MGRLQDKVAIITGAGQGIGLAYAERFLAEGAKVVVAEVNEPRAAGAMKALEGKGDAVFVLTDISDPDSAQSCVDQTVERFGTVHILVNNAALYYEATKKIVPDMYISGMTAMTAMKSTLEPEDLAGACVFFASDDAKFVTGQTLVVDGGLAMPA